MSEEVFDFGSIAPKEFRFKLDGKSFVLREPTAEADCKYRSAMMKGTKFTKDGKEATASGASVDAELVLIAACVFELYHDKGQTKERPTGFLVIRDWPVRVHRKLVEEAEKMRPKDLARNGKEDSAKKAPEPSTATLP